MRTYRASTTRETNDVGSLACVQNTLNAREVCGRPVGSLRLMRFECLRMDNGQWSVEAMAQDDGGPLIADNGVQVVEICLFERAEWPSWLQFVEVTP